MLDQEKQRMQIEVTLPSPNFLHADKKKNKFMRPSQTWTVLKTNYTELMHSNQLIENY